MFTSCIARRQPADKVGWNGQLQTCLTFSKVYCSRTSCAKVHVSTSEHNMKATHFRFMSLDPDSDFVRINFSHCASRVATDTSRCECCRGRPGHQPWTLVLTKIVPCMFQEKTLSASECDVRCWMLVVRALTQYFLGDLRWVARFGLKWAKSVRAKSKHQ